jgi:hypothetical protein
LTTRSLLPSEVSIAATLSIDRRGRVKASR